MIRTLIKPLILGILILSIISGCSKQNQESNTQAIPQSNADFPVYDFNVLAKKSELVVLGKVTTTDTINENDPTNPEATHQLSTLEVLEIYNGKIKKNTINLYQSVNLVEKGKSYVLFLTYREKGDFYVVSDGNSQIEVNPITTNDEEEKLQAGKDFKVKIHGIEGDYTKEEFKKKFNEEFAKIVQ
jgi:hypothetical protein